MNDIPTVIRFFVPVQESTVKLLLNVVDKKMESGVKDLKLLISSPGGNVFYGLTAYNYLKGLPISIITHNCGSVDSIGVVLFCAGSKRLSVPQARFLIHGVSTNFAENSSLEEPQLEERLKSMRIDIENIAKVIAGNTRQNTNTVTKAMLERTTLNPEQAKEWGLVHTVEPKLFKSGSEIITIQ